jgi:O-antigen ligase
MIKSFDQKSDSSLFFLLCATLFIMAWPLGAHRVWASSFLWSLIGLNAFFIMFLLAKNKVKITAAVLNNKLSLGCFTAIVIWIVVQIIPWSFLPRPISLNISESILAARDTIAYGLLFFCVLQLVNSIARLKALVMVLVLSGLFQACYGILTVLGGPSFDIFFIHDARLKTASGTFINRNHFAGYLELCLGLGIGLMVGYQSQQPLSANWRDIAVSWMKLLFSEKLPLRIFLVIMVIALVMSRSRMGNSAFFVSMGICSVLGLIIFRKHSTSLAILFISMIMIDVLIVSTWFGLEQLATRLQQTEMQHEIRLDVNQNAVKWIQDYWLTGSGAGSFAAVFPQYRDSSIVAFFDYAHNDYLQILGEYGLIGSFFFLTLVLLWIVKSINVQVTGKQWLVRGIAFGALFSLFSLLIHSFTDFNLYIQANAALFVVCGALICCCAELKGLAYKKTSR